MSLPSALLLLLVPLLTGCASDKASGAAAACGTALTCSDPAVCVRQAYSPSCETRKDTADACPEGTEPSRCGGDGHPCCCEPTPDATYSCFDASACAAPVGCDCVTAACDDGTACSPAVDGFTCDELAKP
jgi:hypothetical protein